LEEFVGLEQPIYTFSLAASRVRLVFGTNLVIKKLSPLGISSEGNSARDDRRVTGFVELWHFYKPLHRLD